METDPDLAELNEATDEYLRRLAAHAAGILAAREGGYAPKTAAAFRRMFLDTGYQCPKCAQGGSCVMDSRRRADGTVRRQRRCVACGHRFTTMEVPMEEAPATLRATMAALRLKFLAIMDDMAVLDGLLDRQTDPTLEER